MASKVGGSKKYDYSFRLNFLSVFSQNFHYLQTWASAAGGRGPPGFSYMLVQI